MTDAAVAPRRWWVRTRSALVALAIVAAAATAGAFAVGRLAGGQAHALLSPWTFQYWLALLVAAVALAALRARRSALVVAAFAVWPSTLVVPTLVRTAPAPTAHGFPLRVVSANVLVWQTPSREAINWFLESDPDLLAVLECSHAWSKALAPVHERLPYVVELPTADPRGTALLSRYPLRDTRVTLAPTGYLPYIDATVDTPAGPVRVTIVHPLAPMHAGHTEARDAEIAWHAERLATCAIPLIVAGDFNESPDGRAFAGFVETSGLRPAREGFGRTPTWPSSNGELLVPTFLQMAIDHCFVSKHFDVRHFDRGPDIGSDHRPILADLVLRRSP
ncbi:MAG: endonuclease/exonuclease/phosphatase family protein [Phycisphaerae bacterium]|nr:endonuclease/exonuclease/phosphatase family protein [Phycisphaerae bacterium]